MNNYPEPPEGYTDPQTARLMLEDIEGEIDAFHHNQELTGKARKECESLLYAERAAILQIINELP